MVFFVLVAEPIEVHNHHCDKFRREVSECGTWVYEPNIEFSTPVNHMVIHAQSLQPYLIGICIEEFYPDYRWVNMTLTVEATNLEIASILPETDSKHSFLNKPLFFHRIVNRLHFELLHMVLLIQPQYAVRFLRIEQMSFLCCTTDCEVEAIQIHMVIITEMYLITSNEPFVWAPFTIPLLKSAFTVRLRNTSTSIMSAIIHVFTCWGLKVKVLIDMLSTVDACFFTRESCDTAAGINDEWLSLLLRTHVHIHIEVFKVSAITIEGTCLDMCMP